MNATAWSRRNAEANRPESETFRNAAGRMATAVAPRTPLASSQGALPPEPSPSVVAANAREGIASGGSSNSQSTYIWKSKGKEVAVIFAGGKVVTKSQRGLR